MTPIEKVARATAEVKIRSVLQNEGAPSERSLALVAASDLHCDQARAAIEALRPFIHECVGVTSTSEYPIDKAVDAKIDAMLAEKSDG
jgi:hypothetical protein